MCSQETDVDASFMNLLSPTMKEPEVVMEYDVDGDVKTEPQISSQIQVYKLFIHNINIFITIKP